MSSSRLEKWERGDEVTTPGLRGQKGKETVVVVCIPVTGVLSTRDNQ
jgi:hypothetical protein